MNIEQNSLALLSSFNHYIGNPQTYNNNIFYDEIFFLQKCQPFVVIERDSDCKNHKKILRYFLLFVGSSKSTVWQSIIRKWVFIALKNANIVLWRTFVGEALNNSTPSNLPTTHTICKYGTFNNTHCTFWGK